MIHCLKQACFYDSHIKVKPCRGTEKKVVIMDINRYSRNIAETDNDGRYEKTIQILLRAELFPVQKKA